MYLTIPVSDRDRFAVAMQTMACEAECLQVKCYSVSGLNTSNGGWPNSMGILVVYSLKLSMDSSFLHLKMSII